MLNGLFSEEPANTESTCDVIFGSRSLSADASVSVVLLPLHAPANSSRTRQAPTNTGSICQTGDIVFYSMSRYVLLYLKFLLKQSLMIVQIYNTRST